MDGARHLVGHHAHLFHDVDFAAIGPWVGVVVVVGRHHPECRPGAFSLGQLDFGLKVAVLPAHVIARIDAARVHPITLFEGSDEQFAVLDFCHTAAIVGAVDVGLEFIVDASGGPHLVHPLVAECGAVVELVVPHQVVVGQLALQRIGEAGALVGGLLHGDHALEALRRHRHMRYARRIIGVALGCDENLGVGLTRLLGCDAHPSDIARGSPLTWGGDAHLALVCSLREMDKIRSVIKMQDLLQGRQRDSHLGEHGALPHGGIVVVTDVLPGHGCVGHHEGVVDGHHAQ